MKYIGLPNFLSTLRIEDISDILIRYSHHNVKWHPLISGDTEFTLADCWKTIYAVKIIREACDSVYDSRKNAVVRNGLSTRIAYYAHEASACSIVVKVQRRL